MWEAIKKVGPQGRFVDTPESTIVVDGIHISSGFDQQREANVQLERVDGEPNELWLYGVGSGVLVEQALERFPGASVNVVVMNPGVFGQVLRLRDQTDWLADRDVELHLAHRMERFQEPFAVSPGSSAATIPAAYRLRDIVYIKLNEDYNNQYHEKRFRPEQWSDSYFERLRNLPAATELFEQVDSSKAVVVGGGPTLSDLIPRLRRFHKDGVPIAAVDTALKPLLDAGIVPDLCVVSDPTERNLSRFDFDLQETENCPLLFFPFIPESLLRRWPGNKYVAGPAQGWDNLPEGRGWLNELPGFSIGVSVIHLAIDFVRRAGAERVYLAGADFGNPGGSTYAEGALLGGGHDGKTDPEFAPDMQIVDGYGNLIPTNFSLRRFCRYLEQYISNHPEVDFINMSRKGARIRGARYED